MIPSQTDESQAGLSHWIVGSEEGFQAAAGDARLFARNYLCPMAGPAVRPYLFEQNENR
ncbi:MAG: hypothetical protein AB9869_35465 [Verrucomicrobiia bacterium]